MHLIQICWSLLNIKEIYLAQYMCWNFHQNGNSFEKQSRQDQLLVGILRSFFALLSKSSCESLMDDTELQEQRS